MDWLEEVKARDRRKNQILFSTQMDFLRELQELIAQQNHRALVLWALDLAEETVKDLEERYPEEGRPRIALAASWQWARGEVKMREAQRRILDCHAVAKELTSREDIALCHALGQACGVVHAPGHAMGYPVYALTALVRQQGLENCREAVEAREKEYRRRLLYWGKREKEDVFRWSSFMKK